MEDQLVGFELAKLAKEKGFNEFTKTHFRHTGEEFSEGLLSSHGTKNSEWDKHYCRPTQAFLQAWLRQKKSIHVNVIETIFDQYTFGIGILIEGGNIVSDWNYNCFYDTNSYLSSYEHALELGLKHALDFIK